jgi:hypothetical protein
MIAKLYGNWHAPTAPEEPDRSEYGAKLLAWLSGEHVEPTPELLAMIREEFVAQDLFRDRLVAHFQRIASDMSGSASQRQDALELPADPAQQFDAGYNAGVYQGYSACAQSVRKAVVEAQAAVMKV